MKILLISNTKHPSQSYKNIYIEYFKNQDNNYLIYEDNIVCEAWKYGAEDGVWLDLLSNTKKTIKEYCNEKNFLPDLILIDFNYINYNLNKLNLIDINFNNSIISIISHKDFMNEILNSNINLIKKYNISYIFYIDCVYKLGGYDKINLKQIYESKTNVKSFPINYGFESNVFPILNYNVTKNIDFGFSGVTEVPYISPINIRKNLLNKMESICKKHNYSYNFLYNKRFSDIDNYSKNLLNTKIWIDTQTDGGHISARFWELPLHKCVILTIENDIYKNILTDGINSIIIKKDFSNLEEQMTYYMNNPYKLNEIVENAFKEFNDKHTIKTRLEYILKKIKK